MAGGEEAFNTCFTTLYGPGGFGVPYNQSDGFQYPRTGNGFAAVLIYIPGSGQQDKREYLHVPLLNKLQSGKTYCGTLYVNLSNEFKYTADKIGIALTSNSFACNQAYPSPQNIPPLNLTAQVENPIGNYILDTLNWMEVSGTFTATGTEAYLTIGNFYDDANTNIVTVNPPAARTIIYFFIDDVSVEEVFPVKAKNDTLIMQGDSAVVGANTSEAAMYNWQPSMGLSCANCPNPKASPTITTTYTVTKTQCKAITTDIITVSVSPTGVNELTINSATQLMPNPTSGNVTIKSRFDMERAEVLTVTGQLLLTETIQQKEHTLQLDQLSEGIYFVKVVYPNGMSVTKKVVKE